VDSAPTPGGPCGRRRATRRRQCHRQLKVDPPTGEKRSLLIVILLVLPTDFWTRPIVFLFA
jgi:hypothetical protein